ncbi:MAG: cyclic GMP-AMP synthase DncV-like nucleotidyltransferase [Paraclostridium sp.]
MADLNKKFLKFNDKITLTKAKSDNLRTGRNALRDKVGDAFTEAGRNKPKFCGQGSFMMKTTTNPLNDGEYDIDDGVYLQGYDDVDEKDWPHPDTVHNWIKKAVENHTNKKTIDKNTCVRVDYSADYHIDLPAYIVKDDVAYLAHRTKGWVQSDPKSFTGWFVSKIQENDANNNGEQLRRIVKYLKAWKDFKGIDFKGIAITILVGEHFYESKGSDEVALLVTVTNIVEELEDDFKCVKPVIPGEDIFDGYRETRKKSIIDGLNSLKKNLQEAVDEKNEKTACEILKKEFGDRFPKGEDTTEEENSNETYSRAKAPAVIKNDGHSA